MAYLKEEIKAGIIIFTSLMLLTGLVVLIGGSQFLEEFDNYYIKVYNSAGLEVGAQVRLGGVRVGRVVSITPPVDPGEPVIVVIGVKKGTNLYKGTKAHIAQIGFVGDIYLLLSVDNTTDEKFKPGDIIPSEEQVQFAKLMARVDELSQSLNNLITDVNRLFAPRNTRKFENLIEEMNKAIVEGSSNLDDVATSLKKTTGKIELVLNEIEKLIKVNKGEVSILIRNAREGVEEAKNLFKTLTETAKTIDSTTTSVDRTIEFQSRNLANLIDTLTDTTEDLQELIQEIKIKPWSILYKGKTRED